MTATIKVTFNEEGEERTYEATWDGDKWTSESESLGGLLNALSANWRFKGYHPNYVIGLAIEVAEYVNKFMKAELVRSDEIDYSQYPEGTIF